MLIVGLLSLWKLPSCCFMLHVALRVAASEESGRQTPAHVSGDEVLLLLARLRCLTVSSRQHSCLRVVVSLSSPTNRLLSHYLSHSLPFISRCHMNQQDAITSTSVGWHSGLSTISSPPPSKGLGSSPHKVSHSFLS